MAIQEACPHCQKANPAEATICQHCGSAIGQSAAGVSQAPERTAKTRNPTTRRGLLARLKRWWKRRGRRAG